MKLKLQEEEYRLLKALEESQKPETILELSERLEIDQSKVAALAHLFQEKGWVEVREREQVEVILDRAGQEFIDKGEPLIERKIAEFLAGESEPRTTPEIAKALGLRPQDVGKSLRFLVAKNYAERKGKKLISTNHDLSQKTPDEELLEKLKNYSGSIYLDPEEANSPSVKKGLELLKSRGFIKLKERKIRLVSLTEEGRKVIGGPVDVVREVNQLTEEMLLNGTWRDVVFRPYDVTVEAAPVFPGKIHPLRKVLEETRRAFLNMGFTELRGPYVESAFWDFDALFQPQDHPAREMQDTFYCATPHQLPLPEPELVETIRETHETGGKTGSVGWRYRWDYEKAKRAVLRTHTTAVTVAACHSNPHPPQKVFTVGRVFRRETIDYKHLPEFHQVDGIIIDADANFASLLGTLTEFYKQMGFDEVKFRPSFFPYTEPSVEVFVRMPGRKEWFELGGAGIFRPEVVKPAGVEVPVLAWGLGLERLAMIRYRIEDIRLLYLSRLDWLRSEPLSN